ncbi:MAG TPA: TetR/AcrR family transcriptional regulator [Pedobacter sp.]
MGSKDRIQRLKENTRSNLLKAALKIVKQDGWHALSMRKIADEIDYTAPAIYEYFNSKESLIAELSGKGYRMLSLKIRAAKNNQTDPILQLEEMWLAYWNFAFTEKELYQAMFGVEVNCSLLKDGFSKAEEIAILFMGVIRQLMKSGQATEDTVSTKYFTLWSVVHGLVSINLVNKGKSDEINQNVLHEAIKGIIASITN